LNGSGKRAVKMIRQKMSRTIQPIQSLNKQASIQLVHNLELFTKDF
jgi:hypothetical protein